MAAPTEQITGTVASPFASSVMSVTPAGQGFSPRFARERLARPQQCRPRRRSLPPCLQRRQQPSSGTTRAPARCAGRPTGPRAPDVPPPPPAGAVPPHPPRRLDAASRTTSTVDVVGGGAGYEQGRER